MGGHARVPGAPARSCTASYPPRRFHGSIAGTTASGWRARKTIARDAQVPLIAANDVLYHRPDRRPLADVLTCIREKSRTIDRAGRTLAINAERYLKPLQEMLRLFREAPEAIEETVTLSDELSFSLDELRYEYPDERGQRFRQCSGCADASQLTKVRLAAIRQASRRQGARQSRARAQADRATAIRALFSHRP